MKTISKVCDVRSLTVYWNNSEMVSWSTSVIATNLPTSIHNSCVIHQEVYGDIFYIDVTDVL